MVTLGELPKKVEENLRERCQIILNRKSKNFDPIYVLSSLLDPNVAWLVEDEMKLAVLSTSDSHGMIIYTRYCIPRM